MRITRLTTRIFLPFAAGYYLSYLFRSINAVIAGRLADDLGLDAAQLGLLTSVYFLSFAAVQLPLGVALDRFGPRRVQSALLLFAAVGAGLFGAATSLSGLLLGRALIGFGVAGGLTAGLKASALWLPKERLPLINGAFIALGTAGAVTATLPVERLLLSTDWRSLFELLAAVTAACAVAIYLIVPDAESGGAARPPGAGLRAIYADPRFWRLAPLSATCIGTAWALQGLWAAPWLTDVAGLARGAVVHHLFIMALGLCGGAAVIGVALDRLRRLGILPRTTLIFIAGIFIAAELALIVRLPLPTPALWAVIGAMGAATVVSFTMLAEFFPKEIAGRANAALNVLHIGGAFAIQSSIGLVVEQWPSDAGGHYPAAAYATAFGLMIALQIGALVWFLCAPLAVPARKPGAIGRRREPEEARVPREATTGREPARGRSPAMAGAGPVPAFRWIRRSRIPRPKGA